MSDAEVCRLCKEAGDDYEMYDGKIIHCCEDCTFRKKENDADRGRA